MIFSTSFSWLFAGMFVSLSVEVTSFNGKVLLPLAGSVGSKGLSEVPDEVFSSILLLLSKAVKTQFFV